MRLGCGILSIEPCDQRNKLMAEPRQVPGSFATPLNGPPPDPLRLVHLLSVPIRPATGSTVQAAMANTRAVRLTRRKQLACINNT